MATRNATLDSPVFDDLPDEPELAFLALEDFFHGIVEKEVSEWGQDRPPDSVYIEYIGKTLSARTELELDILTNWRRPDGANFTYAAYLNFRHDVVHFRTAMQIRHGRRTKNFSVRLDAKAKRTIHHHITQIRDLLTEEPLDDRKRERPFDKLSAFANEVDRDRTRFESLGAAIVEFGGFVGEAGEKAEPARRLLDSIAKVIWGAKNEEADPKRLPRPAERKRIEAPQKADRKTPPKPISMEDLDDEIPF